MHGENIKLMTRLIVAFHNFVKIPKNGEYL